MILNLAGSAPDYGSQYSMRIWLDPAKLNAVQMTAKDVTDACPCRLCYFCCVLRR
jgi:multidrug efflux pump